MHRTHKTTKPSESLLRRLIREVVGSRLKPGGFKHQLHIPRVPTSDLHHGLRASRKVHGVGGNKPSGGFWTSTLTVDDEGRPSSDWHRWMYHEVDPDWINNQSWVYSVNPSAKVLHINSMEDGERFLEEYGKAKRKESEPGHGFSPGGWTVDWNRVAEDWDALHLAEDFREGFWYGWDAESTVWFRPDQSLKKEASVTVAPIHSQLRKARPYRRREVSSEIDKRLKSAIQQIIKSPKTREDAELARKYTAPGEKISQYMWGEEQKAFDDMMARHGLPSLKGVQQQVADDMKAQEKEWGWEEEESGY